MQVCVQVYGTSGWIAVKFGTDILRPWRMNPAELGNRPYSQLGGLHNKLNPLSDHLVPIQRLWWELLMGLIRRNRSM